MTLNSKKKTFYIALHHYVWIHQLYYFERSTKKWVFKFAPHNFYGILSFIYRFSFVLIALEFNMNFKSIERNSQYILHELMSIEMFIDYLSNKTITKHYVQMKLKNSFCRKENSTRWYFNNKCCWSVWRKTHSAWGTNVLGIKKQNGNNGKKNTEIMFVVPFLHENCVDL